jgi:UDP-N-acetylmuramyl pentapeptide phosphotransferase/UDP-N-acetylglucosamine-1-phosphate transferase
MSVAWLLGPAAAAFILIAILRRSPLASRLADQPNERSLHASPRPRLGGLGIMAAWLPCVAFAGDAALAAIAVAACFLAVVSLLDDLHGMPIEVRFPAHVAAALLAWLAFASPSSHATSWMFALAALFAIVWATNLFNFMDGADGLAGGMAVIGFGAYAYAAHEAGFAALGWSCAALAAASLGFLFHNLPPARVFMGDAGSVPLGFLAGALGVHGIVAGAWPWWFPLLAFLPFVLDATVTILRRLLRGERIWHAHREHFYQRLVLSGWSPRRLDAFAFLLMAACAASAVWALHRGGEMPYVIIAALAAIHGLLFLAIEQRFRESSRR